MLKSIQNELGFGIVYTFNQNNCVYARYLVQGEQNVETLISIFNGNIHLDKVYLRFKNWVNGFNSVYNKSIILKPQRTPNQFSLDTAWFSGFMDAEGGLSASFTDAPRMAAKKRLKLKSYVDQQSELLLMNEITNSFKVSKVTVRSEKNKHYRVEMVSKTSLEKIQNYLKTHKLRSKKRYVFVIWNNLVNLFLSKQHLVQSNSFLEKRVKKLQYFNDYFKQNKTVYRSIEEDINKGIITLP